MKNFFTGLQFLTRIHIIKETEWSPERFGKSVKFFPIIGAVLGICYIGIAYFLQLMNGYMGLSISAALCSVLIFTCSVFLTGGLLCDGLMDTADGLFSGRDRVRMLEIMKDSRVGANGVMAFVILAFLKCSLIADLSAVRIFPALFLMPVLSRLAMVIAITSFPYARPEGIGKAFAQYTDRRSLYFAFMTTSFFLFPFGKIAFYSLLGVLSYTVIAARYMSHRLGGLTGDTYGALTETAEIVVLIIFLFC